MKGDLHPCAVRLMQQLPVRTHERSYAERPVLTAADIGRKHGCATKGWNTSPRTVQIATGRGGHTTFRSVTEASRILHKSTKKIYEWLRDGSGRARYV